MEQTIGNEKSDTTIWRYMDLARYVTFLDRGLFFARADTFADPWEGGLGGADLKLFREKHAALGKDELEQRWAEQIVAKQAALSGLGVSSWHEADHESVALWHLYMPQGAGVAVRSSIRKVCAALDESREVHAVRLDYVDYDDTEIGLDPVRQLSHKRKEFLHEREVRFLLKYRRDELQSITVMRDIFAQRRTRWVTPWPPRPVILPGGAFSSSDATVSDRTTPEGIHLKTDVSSLIDRVVLAPNVSYVIRRAVLAVTKAFGLDRKIINESNTEKPPFDKMGFYDPGPSFPLSGSRK